MGVLSGHGLFINMAGFPRFNAPKSHRGESSAVLRYWKYWRRGTGALNPCPPKRSSVRTLEVKDRIALASEIVAFLVCVTDRSVGKLFKNMYHRFALTQHPTFAGQVFLWRGIADSI
jgi:hypothetical protein